jgi:hypothetical protein
MRYSRAQLEDMSAKELKRMAYHEMGIAGITKKPKDVVISAILEYQASNPVKPGAAPAGFAVAAPSSGPISEMHGGFKTVQTDKSAGPAGFSTTIQVSCGASSGNFPVVGKPVGEVKAFLRDVLNIDAAADAIVNGSKVNDSYTLQDQDKLEFMKKAGKKGC